MNALALAQALGTGWSVENRPHREHVVHRDGYGFWFREDKDRVEIHGDWPTKAGGGELFPSQYDGPTGTITVSATKTEKQVAKDIERRFLPVYLPTWQKQNERAIANRQFTAKAEENAKTLAAAVPGAKRSDNRSPDADITFYLHDNDAHQVRVYADSVRFEFFSTTPEKAIEILKILKK